MLFEMITSPLEWHEWHEREKRNQFLKNSDSRPVSRGGGGGGGGAYAPTPFAQRSTLSILKLTCVV